MAVPDPSNEVRNKINARTNRRAAHSIDIVANGIILSRLVLV